MKVYLAGPMAGYPENNFPAFHKYAAFLRSNMHTVFSPAELEDNKHFVPTGLVNDELRQILLKDLTIICLQVEAIALMPGWENSKGAQAEWALARALGLEFIYL